MMETSDFISLGAAIVAVIALGVSITEALANRPRLKVSHYLAVGVGGMSGDWLVVSVINWGRQPTTIASVSIEFPEFLGEDGTAKHSPHIPRPQSGGYVGDNVPHFLEVGREARFFFLYPTLKENDPDAEGSLPELCKKYGARALVNSAWHKEPIRHRIFTAA